MEHDTDQLVSELQRLIHDLRNPVNVIAMNVELLMLDAQDSNDVDSLSALRRAVVELEQRLIALEGCTGRLPGQGKSETGPTGTRTQQA